MTLAAAGHADVIVGTAESLGRRAGAAQPGGKETLSPGAAGSAPSPSPRPGILLDRDGTIIVDHGYVGSVERVDFIDGAAEAIARFNRARIPVAVLSNQAGVARGLYGLDDVARVHQYIADQLEPYGAHIDLFVYCPYHPAGVVAAGTIGCLLGLLYLYGGRNLWTVIACHALVDTVGLLAIYFGHRSLVFP